MRYFTFTDQLLIQADRLLKTLSQTLSATRVNPAKSIREDSDLTSKEKQQSAALMRVNHSGEIAAQALYYGQSVFSQNHEIQRTLLKAADEEGDHLVWCYERVVELGSRVSYLNPFWYVGAFAIGMVASRFGDEISLGFLAETEKQVVQHLNGHLNQLSVADSKTRAIINFMREDEAHHANFAEASGAVSLPEPIPQLMRLSSKVMTTLAYWV